MKNMGKELFLKDKEEGKLISVNTPKGIMYLSPSELKAMQDFEDKQK